MKAFAVAAIAALLSFPALAQQGATRSQACEELGNAVYSATHVTYEIRSSWQGYGDFFDAQPEAQALAADELDILLNTESYEVVSDIVDSIVIEMYRMPRSEFTGDSMKVFTTGFRMADGIKQMIRARCMSGLIDVGF